MTEQIPRLAVSALLCVAIAACGSKKSADPEPPPTEPPPTEPPPTGASHTPKARAAPASADSAPGSSATIPLSKPAVYGPGSETAGEPCNVESLEVEGAAKPAVQAGKASDLEFEVRAYGPGGSGRYWTVMVQVGGRGVCLETSTPGFRTISGTKAIAKLLPLAWARDVDGDGKSDVVIWGSIAASDGSDKRDYALSAQVYTLGDNGLEPSESLSKTLRTEIAATYREAAREGDAEQRVKLAELLDAG